MFFSSDFFQDLIPQLCLGFSSIIIKSIIFVTITLFGTTIMINGINNEKIKVFEFLFMIVAMLPNSFGCRWGKHNAWKRADLFVFNYFLERMKKKGDQNFCYKIKGHTGTHRKLLILQMYSVTLLISLLLSHSHLSIRQTLRAFTIMTRCAPNQFLQIFRSLLPDVFRPIAVILLIRMLPPLPSSALLGLFSSGYSGY